MSLPKLISLKRIGFFGDAHIADTHPDYVDAYQVARELALQGFIIINGGGPGIMDAATQGAESVEGKTVAVTMKHEATTYFEGRYVRNLDKVDRERVANNYIERMFGLIEESDVFVVFRGGSGTLSELGTIWVLANIYYGHHKPFLLYGAYWWEIIDTLTKHMNLDDQELDCLKIVESKQEVLSAITTFEWKLSQTDHSACVVCSEKAFIT
jgi:uncharacterized protein (TIGR00725 family)